VLHTRPVLQGPPGGDSHGLLTPTAGIHSILIQGWSAPPPLD
jgi:hypothetical protein